MDTTITLWDIPSGKQRLVLGHSGWRKSFGVDSIAVSPDGKTLAAGVNVGDVQLWDIPESNALLTVARAQLRR